MDENKRTHFLRKFARNLHTEAEHSEFLNWIKFASPDELENAFEEYQEIAVEIAEESLPNPLMIARLEAKLDAIDEKKTDTPRTMGIWSRVLAAAVILMVLTAGLYFYNNESIEESVLSKTQVPKVQDALPGSNIAILTLADGSKISLDDAVNGEIARQGGMRVRKTADGQIEYDVPSSGVANATKVLYNTISTPRGGQYQINLPDGSKVWLNAASSLKYPVTFGDKERKVELNGEAFFDINHDKSKPFRVESRGQLVEVYGTEFNINSYSNEPMITTTLLDGSIRVIQTSSMKASLLTPGQEATHNGSGNLQIGPGDITQAVSWKNGSFVFNDMDLVNILRQLERWYDVDVDYANVPQTRYNGNISRTVKLSKVLKMLEVTGHVKFKIEGKEVKISK